MYRIGSIKGDIKMNDYYCMHCKKVIKVAYQLHMMEEHGEVI